MYNNRFDPKALIFFIFFFAKKVLSPRGVGCAAKHHVRHVISMCQSSFAFKKNTSLWYRERERAYYEVLHNPFALNYTIYSLNTPGVACLLACVAAIGRGRADHGLFGFPRSLQNYSVRRGHPLVILFHRALLYEIKF